MYQNNDVKDTGSYRSNDCHPPYFSVIVEVTEQ